MKGGCPVRLEDVHSPADIKGLSVAELEDLAKQIREELITTVSKRGGHLAPNLGVVELTMAIHRVFDVPADKLVFDVGHQSYVHKLLTGRYYRFRTLRSFGGIAGFPKRSESDCDCFETGHSSTAISAALGMARARDLLGEKHHVIAVVGDGALTGGMCYEALNDAGNSKTRLIVILNDNEMSIAPNVGALSQHLTNLRISAGWTSAKRSVRNHLPSVPFVGKPLYRLAHWAKRSVKSIFVKGDGFFDALGFEYFGPIDGHNMQQLEHTLQQARQIDGPVVIHVLTKKGYGYDKAEEKPERFHGIAPFYVETGAVREKSDLPSFGAVMAEELSALAEKDQRIVAISAAMMSGTGLEQFAQRYPDRALDVGIAEEHAATMAAGLAAGGMKPYFAVYTSFFQRSFDQMIHDVCMQQLPVTFLLDRAGLVGEDGATHHGIFDLASMLSVPHMTILAPRDLTELRSMIRFSQTFDGPLAIRYGRSPVDMHMDYPYAVYQLGRWERLEKGKDCAILAVGSMVEYAVQTRDLLLVDGIHAEVVNCSTVKPMDEEMLLGLARTRPIITMEEHMLQGGFGASVCTFCTAEEVPGPVMMFGIPDTYVQHGNRGQLFKYLGLQPKQMAKRISVMLKGKMNHE